LGEIVTCIAPRMSGLTDDNEIRMVSGLGGSGGGSLALVAVLARPGAGLLQPFRISLPCNAPYASDGRQRGENPLGCIGICFAPNFDR
jgi:hypothetical protein